MNLNNLIYLHPVNISEMKERKQLKTLAKNGNVTELQLQQQRDPF